MIPERQRNGRRWLLAWTLCRRLPSPVAYGLGRAGGRAFYELDGGRRRALRANLRQVLGPTTGPAELEATVRRGFASYGRYWIEAFRLEDLGAEEIRRRLQLHGGEHLDAAVSAGRGVILATPHLGNWDAGGAWLAASGYPTTGVVARLEPAELYERFAAFRRALGMELLPLDDGSETLRGVLRALRAGRVACLVSDRDLTGGGLPVRLFGRTTVMPGGPASLALRTRAALLPCAVYQQRPGHWLGVVRPPLEPAVSGDQRADALRLTQRLADEFEAMIARAPDQWHVLSRFWRDPGRSRNAA